ncbi:rhomboid protease GluP [Alkalihalobacillus xiaoxiensis]|uniref:Rhomboid protease GluP n=1 Tax=Shouchella xiaoxiensis TaxID=766895 RepID=A0ABS2SSD3_9BACI|nr:rhomboid family intramembrane serine protease [Shouchella xiaoxiensis]MBM7838145.1 rhomboid protease GluP [Shouchella xiaoxiensis]
MNPLEHRYLYWKIIEHYAVTKQSRLLALHDTQAWFEDDSVKPRRVMRIVLSEVDWSNRLRRDISHAKLQFESIHKQLGVWDIQGENVYIMSQPPVDSWVEVMESTSIGKRKGQMKSIALHSNPDVYYETASAELPSDQIPLFSLEHTDVEMEEKIDSIRSSISKVNKGRQKKDERTLFYGKPRMIYVLLLAILAMYTVLELNGGSTNIQVLIDYGAKYNPLMVEGEWWRLVTSMFLHIGLIHLLFNGMALYFLGTAVEQLFGSIRFLFIYFIAGISGSIVSFAFNDSVSAGASGALFGLFGALLYFGLKQPALFYRTLGRNIIFLLGFNLILGFVVPGIDNGAHIGGLIGGFLAAVMVRMPKEEKKTPFIWSFLSIVSIVVLTATLLWFGQEHSSKSAELAVLEANRLFEEGQYDEAKPIIEEGLELDSEQPELLFMKSYLELQEENIDEAKRLLERATENRAEFPEAWYNLALIHLDLGETNEAAEAIQQAIEAAENLNVPEMDQYYEIQDEIEQQLE